MSYTGSTRYARLHQFAIAFFLLACAALPAHGAPLPVTLGQAFSLGVLAGSTVTNTGPSVAYGNVGGSPGTAITGFPPGTIIGGTTTADSETERLREVRF